VRRWTNSGKVEIVKGGNSEKVEIGKGGNGEKVDSSAKVVRGLARPVVPKRAKGGSSVTQCVHACSGSRQGAAEVAQEKQKPRAGL
jgi:hypothetical protein